MSSQFTIAPITAKTKGEVKQLRRTGFIPVSVQHKGMPTAHYQIEAKPLDEFIRRHGAAAFVNLVEGKKTEQRALVASVQRDPISQKLIQVTFQQVRSDDKVKTHVPLRFVGEPDAVSAGDYIVQHAIDSLEIECAADSLPTHIDVDLTLVQVGHPLRVADLPAHPGYTITASPDTALASLANMHVGRELDGGTAEGEAAADSTE